jgi:hypothetical protein
MLISYIVSFVIVVVISLMAIFVSGALPLWYFDLPSIAMVFLPAFVLCAGDFGWRGVGMAFFAAFGKEQRTEKELAQAQATTAALGRYAWLAAVLGTCIGIIAILASLREPPNPNRLGPNVGVSLICLFYAVMFNFMLITPMRNRIALKQASK